MPWWEAQMPSWEDLGCILAETLPPGKILYPVTLGCYLPFSVMWVWKPPSKSKPCFPPRSLPRLGLTRGAASELWICSGPGPSLPRFPGWVSPRDQTLQTHDTGQVSSPACSPRGSACLPEGLHVLWSPPASTVLGWEEQVALLLPDGLRPRGGPCPESLSRWSAGWRAEPSLSPVAQPFERKPRPSPVSQAAGVCIAFSFAPVLGVTSCPLRPLYWLCHWDRPGECLCHRDKNWGRTSQRTEERPHGSDRALGLPACLTAHLLYARPCFYPEKLRTF